jgi:nucleoside-diphosphate-sugar epimerase
MRLFMGASERHHGAMAASRTGTAPRRTDATRVSITGARSELGRLLLRQRASGSVHINVAGQQANTLLHDGHAWKGFARTALAGVRRAVQADAQMLVHASFAFVRGEPRQDPLRSLAQTILECEALALSAPIPACIVRLGYLYGPDSGDLRAYRKAFRLGRPYWAGPRNALQYHLHQADAVGALLAAAKRRNAGKIFYATDATPVPFMQFMDGFARRIGKRFPLHVPLIAAPLMRPLVRTEHMQQAALAMPAPAPSPRVPGWKPTFPDYRAGLDQIIEAWRA